MINEYGKNGLNDLNKTCKEILKKQKDLRLEIENLLSNKKNLLNKFIIDSIFDKKILKETTDSIDKISGIFTKETNLKGLNNRLRVLYFTVFNNAVKKRVKMNFLFKKIDYWGHEQSDNIWINNRGLAKKSHGWYSRSDTIRTETIENLDDIVNIIKSCSEIKNYLKDNKKDLFDHINKCMKDWIIIQDDSYSRDAGKFHEGSCDINFLEETNEHEYGISSINITKYKYLIMSLVSDNFRIKIKLEKDGSYYDSKAYNINMLKETKGLMILSQLSDDSRKIIKETSDRLQEVYDNNYKLLVELEKNLTPFLVMKAL